MLKQRHFLHAENKKRCAAADSDEELIAMRACEIVCVFCGPKGILVVPVVSYHILLGDVFAVWYHVGGVCRSCRSREELSNAYFLAKLGFDTADNEHLTRTI